MPIPDLRGFMLVYGQSCDMRKDLLRDFPEKFSHSEGHIGKTVQILPFDVTCLYGIHRTLAAT